MNVDWPYVSVVLATSALGFVYFTFGKKTQSFWFMFGGAMLMAGGYFFDSWWAALLVGIAAGTLPFIASKL